jgi:hypothetical protein
MPLLNALNYILAVIAMIVKFILEGILSSTPSGLNRHCEGHLPRGNPAEVHVLSLLPPWDNGIASLRSQ